MIGFAKRQIRRTMAALGLAASHRWNATGYRVIALHLADASRWRW